MLNIWEFGLGSSACSALVWASSVMVGGLSVAETAPLACYWGEFMSLVKLYVLNWVSQAKLMNSRASYYTTRDFNNWHRVDKLLSVRLVGLL